jgi:thiol-activated cytolysin
MLVAPRAAYAADVDVDTYINRLQFKPEEVLAIKGDGQRSTMKQPTVENQGSKVIVTVLKSHKLDKSFAEIALLDPPSKEVIYPGALVKVNRYLVQGTPQALTALNRNKDRTMILKIDLPDLTPEEQKKLIRNPQASDVQLAIEKMTTDWLNKHGSTAAGQEAESTKIISRMESHESILQHEQQLAADLGLGVDASQGSFSSKLKLDKNSTKKVAVMLFKQVFYTVSVDAPRSAADYLGTKAPEELLRNNITAKEPPGYVHSVSYGRMLIVRIESSSDTTDADLNLLFKYTKGPATVDANSQTRIKNMNSNTTVQTIVIGGGAQQAAQLRTSLEELPAAVTKFTQENANFTKNNRAAPIAYTVYFLGGRNGPGADAESNALVLARLGVHTTFTTEEPRECSEGVVVVENKGGFFIRVNLTYQEYKVVNGKGGWHNQEIKGGGPYQLAMGSKFTHTLPAASINVKLLVQNQEDPFGVSWRTVDGLESKTFDFAPRIKFSIFGTTGRSWADPKKGELVE